MGLGGIEVLLGLVLQPCSKSNWSFMERHHVLLMSAGLMTRGIRLLLCVILNAAFSRSRMNRVLIMSDRGRFFLLFFAYNEIVALFNFWILVISYNPSDTMNLATLGFAPIATRTVTICCAAGDVLPDQYFFLGVRMVLLGVFLLLFFF